jgi:hypothetical protein
MPLYRAHLLTGREAGRLSSRHEAARTSLLSAGLPVVVTWRPAQPVLLSVQGMDVAAIADREFGPLNLQLRPGRPRAPVSGKTKSPTGRRDTAYTRTAGYGTCSPPDNNGPPTRCDPRS